MTKNIDKDLLIRYSKGKYSYNDLKKIRECFSSFKYDLGRYLYPHWESILTENSAPKNLHHIYKNIHYDILVKESNQKKSRKLFHRITQIAAVLLIAILFSGLGYLLSKSDFQNKDQFAWVEINAPLGSRVEFFLPDSSRGWLNSGSKLKYSPNFIDNRLVNLTGEGYFEVKHFDNSKFRVSVPDMNIDVLGTKFNVSAYHEDDFTEVVLEKGKVEITGKTGNFNQILKPNEKISFNHQERKVLLSEVNPQKSSAWKEGMLVIDNEPLGTALNRIERWYNISIVIENENLKEYRFKATFIDEPLEEVLKLIAKTTPIKYKIDDRVISENGVVNKRKVTIKLK
jgi:transmembrane sensor